MSCITENTRELNQDSQARRQAIDTSQSFIVQAPAGSGKTELLVQRYLALLSNVNNPEEIIAITFTRKAAAEMHSRIIKALANAQHKVPCSSDHEQITRQLALQALQHNHTHAWNILENPNRLRIQTIDSLCAWLTSQMPMLSDAHSYDRISENCNQLYYEAVQQFFEHLTPESPWQESIINLLYHLDNRYDSLEKLLVETLKSRDQWSYYLLGQSDLPAIRKTLEHNLKQAITHCLANCCEFFPKTLIKNLEELIQFSAAYNENSGKNFKFPTNKLQHKDDWQLIAKLLLTQSGEWRKQVDKRNGFPAHEKEKKQQMEDLLSKLTNHNDLKNVLLEALALPSDHYTTQQWQIIKNLLPALKILVGELKIVFSQHNACDFTEVLLNAEQSLSKIDQATDLALYLDYIIKHLLIDEFQDTSISQFRLLNLLINEWQQSDGRTVFLVGDPMQSIYRFRNAEVGLFLKAKQEGIGQLRLQPLTLYRNFRSYKPLVSWINKNFKNIFPSTNNITTGAIAYTPSISSKDDDEISHAKLDLIPIGTTAHHVTHMIRQLQTNQPNESIAILIRSRTHLAALLPALREHQIAIQGIEIESLAQQMIIQDLLSLTKALSHPADRISWLSVLRAPWCGLTLNQLLELTNNELKVNFIALLQKDDLPNWPNLSRVRQVLLSTLQQRQRKTLSNWIRATWLALGGPACYSNGQLDYADTFFKLLKRYDYQSIYYFQHLINDVNNLYANTTNSQSNPVQIMTIHKAKGLEFDHVIIPHLERKAIADTHQLFLLQERAQQQQNTNLLLAPIKPNEQESDLIYDYLKFYNSIKAEHETQRLFYVAATRSIKSLLLVAEVEAKPDYKPIKSSLLSMLWDQYQPVTIKHTTNTAVTAPQLNNKISRLTDNWQSPFEWQAESYQFGNFLIKNNRTQQQVGILIHELLYHIGRHGMTKCPSHYLATEYWLNQLPRFGLLPADSKSVIVVIESVLKMLAHDSRAQWILTNHTAAESEFAISSIDSGIIKHHVIDRTFIVENVRWIIDFKSATPDQHEAASEFLVRQKQIHIQQLTTYASIIAKREQHPIMLGIYFPLCGLWLEFPYSHGLNNT